MSDLDRDLESELHRVLDPLSALTLPPRRAVRSRGPATTVLGGAGAALTVKVLSGVAVVAAAVSVAGAATTGSLNPTVWGHEVTTQIANHGQAASPGAGQHSDGSGSSKGTAGGKDAAGGKGNGGAPAQGNANGNTNSGQGNDQSSGNAEPIDPATPGNPKNVTPKP